MSPPFPHNGSPLPGLLTMGATRSGGLGARCPAPPRLGAQFGGFPLGLGWSEGGMATIPGRVPGRSAWGSEQPGLLWKVSLRMAGVEQDRI